MKKNLFKFLNFIKVAILFFIFMSFAAFILFPVILLGTIITFLYIAISDRDMSAILLIPRKTSDAMDAVIEVWSV